MSVHAFMLERSTSHLPVNVCETGEYESDRHPLRVDVIRTIDLPDLDK